jgi:hypothetical protein
LTLAIKNAGVSQVIHRWGSPVDKLYNNLLTVLILIGKVFKLIAIDLFKFLNGHFTLVGITTKNLLVIHFGFAETANKFIHF